MLHDLIFALYGCPNKQFIDLDGKICVAAGILDSDSQEIHILEHLCSLGTYYKGFKDFVSENDGVYPSNEGRGMYIRAFCNGLNEVLVSYRDDLIELEELIINDPFISLFLLQSKLNKYHLLFPALYDIVREVKEKKLHGCQILNAVYKHYRSQTFNQAFNKLFQICHHPFLKQLISWMIHGSLFDPYGEFIIKKDSTDSATELEKALAKKTSEKGLESMRTFKIDSSLLPDYVPVETATNILFVGSSVNLFGNRQDPLNPATSFFGSNQLDYSKMLYSLQEDDFSPRLFKLAVSKLHLCAVEHLWKVVVEEADLLSHFYLLKEFYLLGKGELYLTFIDQARSLLDVEPIETTEWDVNRAFHVANRAISNPSDKEDLKADKFNLIIRDLTEAQMRRKQKGSIIPGWQRLAMNYTVDWPLHTILTPEVLFKYNRIFKFLLAVRQVQQDLQYCWLIQMRSVKRKPRLNRLWNLWSHMMFLIDSLQYYLQNEVLESQFSLLVKQVESKKDFEAIHHAHDVFLSSVLSLSFVTWKQVHDCLFDVFIRCHELCRVALISESREIDEDVQVEPIQLGFQRLIRLLFRSLSIAHSQQKQLNLRMLILKCDFNEYFTSIGYLD